MRRRHPDRTYRCVSPTGLISSSSRSGSYPKSRKSMPAMTPTATLSLKPRRPKYRDLPNIVSFVLSQLALCALKPEGGESAFRKCALQNPRSLYTVVHAFLMPSSTVTQATRVDRIPGARSCRRGVERAVIRAAGKSADRSCGERLRTKLVVIMFISPPAASFTSLAAGSHAAAQILNRPFRRRGRGKEDVARREDRPECTTSCDPT